MSKKIFSLDKEFYSDEVVNQAISAFEDFVIFFENGVLIIDDQDPQAVFDEFSNYCIYLLNA